MYFTEDSGAVVDRNSGAFIDERNTITTVTMKKQKGSQRTRCQIHYIAYEKMNVIRTFRASLVSYVNLLHTTESGNNLNKYINIEIKNLTEWLNSCKF